MVCLMLPWFQTYQLIFRWISLSLPKMGQPQVGHCLWWQLIHRHARPSPSQPLLYLFSPLSFSSALADFDITGNFNSEQRTRTAIAINSTRQSISITISEDTIFEGTENFTLELLVHGRRQLGITVAMPEVTTVTIVDNECRCTPPQHRPSLCAMYAIVSTLFHFV